MVSFSLCQHAKYLKSRPADMVLAAYRHIYSTISDTFCGVYGDHLNGLLCSTLLGLAGSSSPSGGGRPSVCLCRAMGV